MNTILSEGHYFGCCEAARNIGLLVVSESAYAPCARVPKHAHQNSYFIFALSGGQEESYGARARTYIPSTLAFHPAGETHCESVGRKGLRCLHVEFRPQWTERHPLASEFLLNGSQFEAGRLGWLAGQVHREFRDFDDLAPTAIEGLVLEMLAAASRLQRADRAMRPQKWMAQAEEMIRSRYSEPLSLSEVATVVGVHPVRLARAFRENHRCSVGEFIRRIRIESASKAMLTMETPLIQIALDAGFADQPHFSRTFKRVTGLTPSQFRAARVSR